MDTAILFVDDNPVILKAIETAFRKEPFRLLFARSGEEGLELVRLHHPKVIVSDLRMDGMDGITFLKEARKEDERFVGMIFTAYMDLDRIMEAVSEEAVWRYIPKPWQDNRELVLAVWNALGLYEANEARRHAEEQLFRAERLAALGQLVTGIAHQFNNINVGIMGYTQMAAAHPEIPEEVRQHLDKILQFTRRATTIVKELAAFSDQSLLWGFSRLDLSHVVSEELSRLQKTADLAGVELTADLPAGMLVEANFGLVNQLLANLVINSAHATLGKENRTIRVSTRRAGDKVVLEVQDNGCGIPKRYLSRIFDPFFTTKGAQAAKGSPLAEVPGVGLGLSLCQTIAQNHGGMISVNSEEGIGTTVTFTLPAVTDFDDPSNQESSKGKKDGENA